MKIACVIAAERLEEAVKVVHDEFFSESEGHRSVRRESVSRLGS
jgi:hypothetical protein